MTLYDLIKHLGLDVIASTLGITERALVDLRRGFTALTVDDLYLLQKAFPTFDTEGTVRRLAVLRLKKGRARVQRRAIRQRA